MESGLAEYRRLEADLVHVSAYSVATAGQARKQRFMAGNAYAVDVSNQAGLDAVLTTCVDIPGFNGYSSAPSQNWLIDDYLNSPLGAAKKAKVDTASEIKVIEIQSPKYGRIGQGANSETPKAFGYFQTDRDANGLPTRLDGVEDSAAFLVLYGGLRIKVVYKLLLGVAGDYDPPLCVNYTMNKDAAQADNPR